MTPAARIAAAIEILDRYLGGAPAEKALTGWARGNRYAGSKDRAAIRDLVFDAIRQKKQFSLLGGGESGRSLMIGALRSDGRDPAEVFTGEGYGPPHLTPKEAAYVAPPDTEWSHSDRFGYPDWLADDLAVSLGSEFEAVMDILRRRAPAFVRVNIARTDRRSLISTLASEGIVAKAHPLAETAVLIVENARRLRQTTSYRDGLFEFQDAASQAVIDAIGPPKTGGRALDFCAGGGGKALALAALGWDVTAYDANQARMKDLPVRARRAGVEIELVDTDTLNSAVSFDLVLVDAPCTGSGAWRRQPESKWSLTRDSMTDLTALQAQIIDRAVHFVAETEKLVYATCSLLKVENEDQVLAFLNRNPEMSLRFQRQFSPLEGGDGFFLAEIEKQI